jgi:hypothetical protein
MGTAGPFPWGKARPGRDADHLPPSSAEVMNEYELYLLSPQASPWRVEGLLYLLLLMGSMEYAHNFDQKTWNKLLVTEPSHRLEDI